MNYRIFLVCAAAALLTSGCAAQHRNPAPGVADAAFPQSAGRIDKTTEIVSTAQAAFPETVPGTAAVGKLALAEALGLTLQHNPTLAAFDQEIRARDAAALQAGLLPNPDLVLEVENFAGQDNLRDFDAAETTIAFTQLVELGDKRNKRRQMAGLEKDLADWDYQSEKLDVLAATARAFVQVLVAQEKVSLNEELLTLAEKTAVTVGERVAAGKVSPMENTRAQVELAQARNEADRTARELEAARRRLASFWGSDRAGFTRVTGDLTDIAPIPSEETLRNFLRNNPDLSRWQNEIDRSEAALALARSEAVPDLTVSAGVRNFQETGDNALVVGITLPLPLFDRNQGGIDEALAKRSKALRQQQAALIALQTELAETWQNLSAAYVESSSLRDEILSGAQDAYESTGLGYREGKLDFLQMLDAQRTLFTVKRQYLLALGAYHLTGIDMERLIGASLSSLAKSTKNQDK
jgi:cobalt-zinc-cadmium efflux system outer membrane protein